MQSAVTPPRPAWLTGALWLLVALLLAVFAALAYGVYRHHVFGFDAAVLRFCHRHVTPARTDVARALSFIGEPTSLGPATLLIVLLLAALRRWLWALLFALQVGGAAALDLATKALVQRPRPALYPHLVHETNFSFPSGHAMGGLAFFLALHLLLWRTLPRRWRWLGLLGLALAAVIGASRPYLQVHYPTDVLAGWAFGAGWTLALQLLLWRPGQARAARRALG
jgi:membrane-associated phospholipid phosphatase